MPTSNPFRRKMAEDRDRSARSSLEGSCPSTISSADELSPAQGTKATPYSSITTETVSTPTLTSSTSPPHIPPTVSPRVAKRRPLPPPPPPPARSASRRVSPVIEPHPAPPPPPTPVSVAESETEVDPFEQASEASDDDEDAVVKDEDEEGEEPSAIAPLPPPPIRAASVRSGPGALNPFRKSSDPIPNKRQSFDISSIRFGTGKAGGVVVNEAQRASVRQSLDVDAFKRLILTGRTDQIGDSPESGKGAQLLDSPETKPPGVMTENMGLVMNGDLKSREEAISANSGIEGVWTESISESPPARRQDASVVVMENPAVELPQATLTPPPILNMTPTSSARVKPLPPRPRIRSSGSPHSGPSSSIQLTASSASPSSSSTSSSTSSSATPPAAPLPSTLSSPPPLAISSIAPGDSLDTRQSPLPTPSLEERAQSPANTPSPLVLKKPLPPSPPLSRMDSKRRSTLPQPPLAANPPGGLSRSNSASRRPPPPPVRRAHPSSFAPPTLAQATGASIAINTSPPSADGLSKSFSPPPPPPRGTRRKGALGEPSGVASTAGRIPSPIPILHSRPVGGLEGGNVISTESIIPGTWTEGKHEEDILADLESLQREVEKLKGMVESRSGVVL